MTDHLNADLTDPDSKTTEKTPLLLNDLPIDVLQIVTEKLPLPDCMVLRKVSQDMKSLVDSSQTHCDVLELWFGERSAIMKVDNLELTYDRVALGLCEIISKRKDIGQTKTYRCNQSYQQALIADASTFLKNPKLEIGHIDIEGFIDVPWNEFTPYLKSLKHPLNVKSIRSRNSRFLQTVQEFMIPEKLEEIVYRATEHVYYFNHFAMIDLEVLKHPKLKIERIIFIGYNGEVWAKFSGILKSFNFQLHIQSIVVGDVEYIPLIFHLLNPKKVEDVRIEGIYEINVELFQEVAGMREWRTKTRWLDCDIPEGLGLEQFVDFKEIRSRYFELTEENLIKIRDILLKSPHLNAIKLSNYPTDEESMEDEMKEMKERIDRIMGEDPSYDASSRRFSIPDSTDYFQLKFEKSEAEMVLTIERIASK